MADTTTLIRRALDSRIELQIVDGKLRVTGKRSAVTTWAPKLREHKAVLIERLQESSRIADQVLREAMRACDHHGDNDSAREAMRKQVLETPPGQMADLAEHFKTTYPVGKFAG